MTLEAKVSSRDVLLENITYFWTVAVNKRGDFLQETTFCPDLDDNCNGQFLMNDVVSLHLTFVV